VLIGLTKIFCYNKNVDEEKSNTWRDIVCILTLFWIPPVGVILTWLVSRWSNAVKWVATIFILVIPMAILGTMSYNGWKFVQFQRGAAPVLGVQQALDLYGLANNQYPAKLDDLKPKYLLELPAVQDLQYTPSEDKKSYSLKAKVLGKDLELRPALVQLPAATQ